MPILTPREIRQQIASTKADRDTYALKNSALVAEYFEPKLEDLEHMLAEALDAMERGEA